MGLVLRLKKKKKAPLFMTLKVDLLFQSKKFSKNRLQSEMLRSAVTNDYEAPKPADNNTGLIQSIVIRNAEMLCENSFAYSVWER